MNEIITKNRAMGSNISPGIQYMGFKILDIKFGFQSMKSSAYGLGVGGSDVKTPFGMKNLPKVTLRKYFRAPPNHPQILGR